jgi:hypothetical protein
MKRRRKFVLGLGGCALVAMLVLAWLAFVRHGHTVEVAVKFIHRDTYPNAIVLAWVTNNSSRPVLLDDAKVYFRSDGGSESWDLSHWDLPADQLQPALQPGGVTSFSLPTWDGQAQVRLTFRYYYEEPLRRSISPVIRVGAQLFGLKPQGSRDSHNTWWWLANKGLLDGRVKPVYDGGWARWEKISDSK